MNLAFRFLLELLALLVLGFWGWSQAQGLSRLLPALLIPLLAAGVWATFRVPAESPSGQAPVPTPGPARLLLEICIFGFAVWGLFDAGAAAAGWALGLATLLHYAASYRRVVRLLRR